MQGLYQLQDIEKIILDILYLVVYQFESVYLIIHQVYTKRDTLPGFLTKTGQKGVSKNAHSLLKMAIGRYLMYEATAEVAGKSWYTFRVVLMDDQLQTLYKLLGSETPQELATLQVPILVPSFIAEGETFSVFGAGGTWSAPEDMYFIYSKGAPHAEGVYPVAPGEEAISISQTFLDRPQVVYCEVPGEEVTEWPAGDDPDDKEIDEFGWAYPNNFENWGYEEKSNNAIRVFAPWYYTDVWIDRLWLWAGCDYSEEENHFAYPDNYNNPASMINNIALRWGDPHFIWSCHEEDSSYTYWVERETIGSESISVWMFEADVPAYYYPHLVVPVSVPQNPILPIILAGAFFLTDFLHADYGHIIKEMFYVSARPKKVLLGDSTIGLLGDSTTGLIGSYRENV